MEISEFLSRKLSKRFRTYDDDGDGFIEREDFAAASRRLGAEFGHGPESEAWQRFDALCGVYGEFVRRTGFRPLRPEPPPPLEPVRRSARGSQAPSARALVPQRLLHCHDRASDHERSRRTRGARTTIGLTVTRARGGVGPGEP